MRINDLVSLYVAYIGNNGGKKRPVLIRKIRSEDITAFKITSKYAHESEYIKQQYYPIQDWKISGLNRQSWVDIGTLYSFPKDQLTFKEIGHLTDKDLIGIDRFVHHYNEYRQIKKFHQNNRMKK